MAMIGSTATAAKTFVLPGMFGGKPRVFTTTPKAVPLAGPAPVPGRTAPTLPGFGPSAKPADVTPSTPVAVAAPAAAPTIAPAPAGSTITETVAQHTPGASTPATNDQSAYAAFAQALASLGNTGMPSGGGATLVGYPSPAQSAGGSGSSGIGGQVIAGLLVAAIIGAAVWLYHKYKRGHGGE